jgi:hypothetical protein
MNERKIVENLEQNKNVSLSFYIMDEEIQHKVHFLAKKVLEKYDCLYLLDIVYSSLKELIINGIKANMKHHLMLMHEIKPEEEGKENGNLAPLKKMLRESQLPNFKEIAKKENLKVKVSVKHKDEKLIFQVQNNTPMTETEKQRIRNKFEKALEFDSIAEYYIQNADQMEGSGLGITMIVLMLKGAGIDPKMFSVKLHRSKQTLAKVEFPLKNGT